jgi:hypothetical protein
MKRNWDAFTARYELVNNHFDANAAGDGFMFETYGVEMEFIKLQPRAHVWTLVDADGKEFVLPGYHFVNRLGYFLTR